MTTVELRDSSKLNPNYKGDEARIAIMNTTLGVLNNLKPSGNASSPSSKPTI